MLAPCPVLFIAALHLLYTCITIILFCRGAMHSLFASRMWMTIHLCLVKRVTASLWLRPHLWAWQFGKMFWRTESWIWIAMRTAIYTFLYCLETDQRWSAKKRATPVGLEPTTSESHLTIRSPTRYPLRHGAHLAVRVHKTGFTC